LGKLKNLILVTALVVFFGGCMSHLKSANVGGNSQRSSGRSHEPFRVFYYNSNGKVGHHINVKPTAVCEQTWGYSAANLISPELPPGTSLNHGVLGGTPSQPGSWELKIRFIGLHCGGVSHPDYTGLIQTTIKGFAAESI